MRPEESVSTLRRMPTVLTLNLPMPTFTNEDMEAIYPDHRKPLYLFIQINFVGVKRALVDTGSSLNLIPLSIIIIVGIPQ
ncbi:hypothetical protein SLE2022_211730 [Rubroshorea leprosula]